MEIHNRHISILVCQITSEVLVSKDGVSIVFSPRELIGLIASGTNGVLWKKQTYIGLYSFTNIFFTSIHINII